MKVVVIGAAPTALGVAYRLNDLKQTHPDQAKDVELLILEQNDQPGGLSGTVVDDKGFLWDMGGHITFSHNFPYYEQATKWAVEEWNTIQRNCLVDVSHLFNDGEHHMVPYPAQFAVPLFPDEVKQKCLKELRERYENPPTGFPETFKDWVIMHFGQSMLDAFFTPYTKKVWTVDTSRMSPSWVGTRVAKLPQEKLDELCAMDKEEVKKADFGWGPNATFNFPKYGGTGAVWKQMSEKLPREWFQYNSRVTAVNADKKTVTYEDTKTGNATTISYDVLVNSTPIDGFVKKTGICPELNLEHNQAIIEGVFVVGVGQRLPMPEHLKQFSWLYFSSEDVPFYRATMFSRYGEVTPDNTKYWSVLCECARPIDDEVIEDEILDLAVKGLIAKGIAFEDRIVSKFVVRLSYGYPIPTVERDAELARAHQALEAHSIYSRGRFGGWKYEVSNQDHCFMQGKELVDRILLNEPEKVYKTCVNDKQG